MDNEEHHFETRISDLESNQVALGLQVAELSRPLRKKIADWIRRRLGRRIPDPPALALWITVPREETTDDEVRPIKFFAAKGKTK